MCMNMKPKWTACWGIRCIQDLDAHTQTFSWSLSLRRVHWWTCVFISLTASKWQLGQDRVWVQDTENSKTSHCGYCPRGHWWPGSRVRRRHRVRVLLVKVSAGKRQGESRDCWTDSWRDQPRCTYEYRGLLWPRGEIFIVPFDPVQDSKDLFWNLHEKLV